MPTFEQLSAQDTATLSGTTVLAVQVAGVWKKTTVQDLRNFLLGGSNVPVIPAVPTVQNVVDALIDLGLVTQAP